MIRLHKKKTLVEKGEERESILVFTEKLYARSPGKKDYRGGR